MIDSSLYGYSVDDFKEEARELLARAEAVLNEIRESPEDHDKINALFRVIHSLKGSAAYAGLKDVNVFSHLYESFLGELRSKKYKTDQDVLNILLRARDYLDDLIFQPEVTGTLCLDETATEPMKQLAMVLKGKGAAPADERESGIQEVVREEKTEGKVSLTTQDPKMMNQKDVIKATIMNILKVLYGSLKDASPDREVVSRSLSKLEDSFLWAFGDESDAVIKPMQDMKGLVSGPLGPNDLSELRKRFNSLAAALKKELSSLDSPGEEKAEAKEEVKDDNKRPSAEEVRGATKDEIVKITLSRSLDALASLLEDASPDYTQINRLVGRLKDLNHWAFHEDEGVNRYIKAMEDLLRRPYDEAVGREMKARYSSMKPVFAALLGEKEKVEVGVYGHTHGQESEIRSRDGVVPPLQEPVPLAAPSSPEVKTVRSGFKPAPTSGSTLRVRSEDLESLISTIGELAGLDPKDFERLHDQALQLRMVPVGEIFSRFNKVARDLSDELGKEIDIEISGESVRLDKVIADRLNEPLLHMVRNAASHGIETPEERRKAGKGPAGLIRLNAFQEGGQIIIEISDNGKGISLEKVRKRGIESGLLKAGEGKVVSEKTLLDLIFAPGFSTMDGADRVSGRGVGMDVVKDVITSLQGTVSIDTKEGIGTTFRLQLPLTLAIIKAMVLEQGGNKIALPSTFVDRVITMSEEELEGSTFMDEDRPSLDLAGEGEVLPLVNLSRLFGMANKSKTRCVVIVRAGMGQKAALVVDSALGRQPLMIKPLDRFAENRYFSSASFVNEEVVLVMNTPSLMAA